MARQLFTSESVSMGHPDKMCDQISDAVLDAMLEQDPFSRVACETLTTTGMVLLAGEVTTKAEVEFPALVRDVVRFIGYTSSEMGFDADTCAVQVAAVVLSTQHAPDVSYDLLRADVVEQVIRAALPANWIDANTVLHVNPTGRFVVGGPMGDAGLTGRKIIVDTYGGMGRHGGGAFSGKDPSKVDRSAAYAARWVAKNLVAAGIARRVEVQVAYAIGIAEPVSVMVETFGTNAVPEERIERAVRETFSLKPATIIKDLDLLRPIYEKTAVYGHFGRSEPEFTWERTDRAESLRSAAGLKGKATSAA